MQIQGRVYQRRNGTRRKIIFENEKALKYLKTVYEYSQNGYISNNVDIANDAYICSLSPAMPLYYDSSKIVSSGYLQQEELNGVVGISSSSKNKETAFELLALLNTDEELANIIYNGAEGRNYAVKDGEKYPNKNALPFYDVAATMTNSIIAESNSQDNQSKRRILRYAGAFEVSRLRWRYPTILPKNWRKRRRSMTIFTVCSTAITANIKALTKPCSQQMNS